MNVVFFILLRLLSFCTNAASMSQPMFRIYWLALIMLTSWTKLNSISACRSWLLQTWTCGRNAPILFVDFVFVVSTNVFIWCFVFTLFRFISFYMVWKKKRQYKKSLVKKGHEKSFWMLNLELQERVIMGCFGRWWKEKSGVRDLVRQNMVK